MAVNELEERESSIVEKLAGLRVIPVLAVESAAAALPLADALAAGGLPVAEITFRTEAAAEVIRTLTAERPGMLVGAGTVTSPDQARAAAACGAAFAVAPGFNPRVVAAARAAGLPFMPGVMTPTDIEAALEAGASVVKFFPADAAGGVKMLMNLSAPYAHLGVRFIPTGGISSVDLLDYLAVRSVLAVGGTWLATRDDISAGRWDAITEKCREVRALLG